MVEKFLVQEISLGILTEFAAGDYVALDVAQRVVLTVDAVVDEFPTRTAVRGWSRKDCTGSHSAIVAVALEELDSVIIRQTPVVATQLGTLFVVCENAVAENNSGRELARFSSYRLCAFVAPKRPTPISVCDFNNPSARTDARPVDQIVT
jgi:hypothetical protein